MDWLSIKWLLDWVKDNPWKALLGIFAVVSAGRTFVVDSRFIWKWLSGRNERRAAKCDSKVDGYFEESLHEVRKKGGSVLDLVSLDQIASHLRMQQDCVLNSLRRLETQQKVMVTPGGWRYVLPHKYSKGAKSKYVT